LVSPALGSVADQAEILRALCIAVFATVAMLPLHGVLVSMVVTPLVVGDSRREQRLQQMTLEKEQYRVDAFTDGMIREGDIVAGPGGDEFSTLLPATTVAEAFEVLERLRLGVDRFRVRTTKAAGGEPVVISPTVSIGVSLVRPGDTLAEALKRADAALYVSKRSGRHCVTISGQESSQQNDDPAEVLDDAVTEPSIPRGSA
jgi:predicted signal transduction protein with EAL and GGDEF domain